ncbi:hypothetical protein Bsp3421_002744 [Burkholderia sp. FERM BP-3421]|jgi:hypothetical protein|uniref:hypothetical protein n=1 Tax=Burkholderia sp. FERM BP-3421 TaxID=1494466 RepID=UPI0023623542|nr:hypothetical protein [Burkholderia sp. FERM BP-3421]WDD92718.1 hypothetical protein Bsp3421_002744 [Burkholderia sp. FERM BP-3421]
MKRLSAIDTGALRARLHWAVFAAGRRLGPLGMLAGAVLAVSPLLYTAHLGPETERLEAARAEHRRTLAALPRPDVARGAGGMTLRDVQQLRSSEQAYSVFEILMKHGVERKHATYRREAEVKGQLRRLTIGIAASGTYLAAREALRAIADQPMARIESVTFEREKIDSPLLDITLRISLLGPDA